MKELSNLGSLKTALRRKGDNMFWKVRVAVAAWVLRTLCGNVHICSECDRRYTAKSTVRDFFPYWESDHRGEISGKTYERFFREGGNFYSRGDLEEDSD